jgi:hypothetical protein
VGFNIGLGISDKKIIPQKTK